VAERDGDRFPPPAGPIDAAVLLDAMTEGVSVASEDGIIVYTNPAEDRLFGYGPGELIGCHVSVQNCYPPEENERLVGEVIATLKSHGVWEGEWLNRRKDGSAFTTASRISAIEIAGRTHWLCVQRDVTAERNSELRFRQLANVLPAFVWFGHPDGTLHFMNERWYDYTGQTPEEALPHGWADTLHPNDRAHVAAAWAEAREREASYEVECRYRSRAGAFRWYLARAEPVRDGEGRVTAWFGTSSDIHDRRRAEEEARESATRLDLAVTAHGIGIFDWHIPSGHVIWSEQEETVFGLPRRSFGGRVEDWAARVVPEDLEAMNAAMAAAMAQGRESLDFAFRIRRPDGELRWIEGSSRFLYAADGSPERMVGTNMDATERRRSEEHQGLLVNELNHRVKNMLAVVQGLAHQSFRAPGIPEGPRRAFEERLAAVSSAHAILTREDWEGASLRAIAEEALGAHRLGERRVTIEGPALTIPARAAVSLALALHELGTNAAKYGALSAEGGRVDLSWTQDGGRLCIDWRESGGPAVVPPTRTGFGTSMIERVLASDLSGTVAIDYAPEGVICRIEAPLAAEAGAAGA
jgi:PAS domain S-box-containing protein